MVVVIPSIVALIFPRIIVCKKALELILSGKIIGASDALEMDFINRLIAEGSLEEEVKEFVDEIARHSLVLLRKHAYREDELGKGQDGCSSHG